MDPSHIRYMIIDDEPIAHRIIEDYCSNLEHLALVSNCYNAIEAMQYLAANQVDLMFLDINMPKLKGFEFLKTLNNPPKVIVTTAYQEYAVEGFELNVCDYLLKPFSFERFLTAVNKVTGQINMAENSANKDKPSEPVNSNANIQKSEQRIFIKGDKKHHQIRLDDIYYIEACGNYCQVFLKESKIITHQKISTFVDDLPSERFMRVHKSYLVAVDKISSISASVIQIGEIQVPIGQTYKQQVVRLIGG